MSTDNTPPRVWWDGSDFLYLISDDALASRQERVPGFYRARTVKDLPDDAVELRPAPAPAVPDTAEPSTELDNLTAEVRRTRSAAVKLRKERDAARALTVALLARCAEKEADTGNRRTHGGHLLPAILTTDEVRALLDGNTTEASDGR